MRTARGCLARQWPVEKQKLVALVQRHISGSADVLTDLLDVAQHEPDSTRQAELIAAGESSGLLHRGNGCRKISLSVQLEVHSRRRLQKGHLADTKQTASRNEDPACRLQ